MIDIINSIDISILTFIQNNIRSDIATPFWSFISLLGTWGAIWIASILILLAVKKTRKTGITAAISLVLEALITNVALKPLIARPRPFDAVDSLTYIGIELNDYSFPSGHTAAAFACSLVMLKLLPKKIGIPAVILSVLIGFSRIYLGAHYPSDVIAGFVIGMMTGGIALTISGRFSEIY